MQGMRRPDATTTILLILLLALVGLAWHLEGIEAVQSGVLGGVRTLLSVIPLLIAAFLIAGLTQVIVSQQVIERWLSGRSGWRGILIACVAGGLIPGGPYVYYPIAGGLLLAGAGIGPLVAFVVAKNLWSLTRLPFEFALLGPQFTIVRYLLTLAVPPILGFLAEWLFGGRIERIRSAVQ
jgi:uncharacterized membrane protein YraQ (UPF0718 family)